MADSKCICKPHKSETITCSERVEGGVRIKQYACSGCGSAWSEQEPASKSDKSHLEAMVPEPPLKKLPKTENV
jgi:hypothetical protein